MGEVTVRTTAADELREVARATRVALLDGPPDDDAWATAEPSWTAQRSFSAWDGDRCVGHVSYFDVDTVVPGGARVRTAAVTRAGVVPTYTRRGIFRRLMDELHADAVDRGCVLTSLRASEATIYERFGYGLSGLAVTATIDTSRARPLRGAATGGTLELVDAAAVAATVRPVYDRSMSRPGTITRPDWLWDRYFEKVTGHTAESVVVHRDAGGDVDGYAHYDVEWSATTFGSDVGAGHVHEVWATNPAAEIALWDFVLGISPVRSVKVDELAADSVVFAAAADPRAVAVTSRWDEQWVRLADLDAALAARRYPAAASVVIGVGPNAWRIGGNDGGATPTTSAPDLSCDAAGLGAVYMGSTSWWDLAASGRATATSDDAVTRADALFAHRPLAFSGSFF